MTERKKHAKAKEPRAGSVDANDDDVHEEQHAAAAGFEGHGSAFDRDGMRFGSPTDSALAALLDAGPEAVEHLLKAAQELLLAAKAVVDAGERAVESHRQAADAAGGMSDAPDRDPRVRRIDLA